MDLSDIKCWFKTYHSDTLTNLYNFSVTQDTPRGGIVLVSQMIVFYNRCSIPGSLRFRIGNGALVGELNFDKGDWKVSQGLYSQPVTFACLK